MTLISTRNVQSAIECVEALHEMITDVDSAVPTSEELRAKLEETVTSMPSTEPPNKAKQSAWITN